MSLLEKFTFCLRPRKLSHLGSLERMNYFMELLCSTRLISMARKPVSRPNESCPRVPIADCNSTKASLYKLGQIWDHFFFLPSWTILISVELWSSISSPFLRWIEIPIHRSCSYHRRNHFHLFSSKSMVGHTFPHRNQRFWSTYRNGSSSILIWFIA